jgi:hypothetical protein
MRGAWPVSVVAWLWLWRGCAGLLVVLMMSTEILGAKPHHAALPRSFRHGYGTRSPPLPCNTPTEYMRMHAALRTEQLFIPDLVPRCPARLSHDFDYLRV